MNPRALRLTAASEIQAREVRWLWRGYVPMGKVTVLAGAPGLGKTLLSLMLAARVSRIADVLIASGEDDPADTIKPRLLAAGANCERVRLMDMRELAGGVEVPGIVQLPGDAYAIHASVFDTAARLVILDPVAAFLDGDHSAYREQEVRAALAPLKAMAEETGCAVLLVMHLNKSDGSDPLRRIANSGAFTALARSVLLFGPDPEDEEGDRGSRRILTVAKGNLRGPGRGSLQMAIDTVPIPTDDGMADAARLVEIGASNLSAEDLLGTAEDRGVKGEVMTWLRDELAGAPIPAQDVVEAAAAEGYSKRTLYRAKAALGVRSIKDGARGGWLWTLDQADLVDGGNLGNLGESEVATVGNLRRTPGNVAKNANSADGDELDTPEGEEAALAAIADAFPGAQWERPSG